MANILQPWPEFEVRAVQNVLQRCRIGDHQAVLLSPNLVRENSSFCRRRANTDPKTSLVAVDRPVRLQPLKLVLAVRRDERYLPHVA
jgi:hypothetical protein